MSASKYLVKVINPETGKEIASLKADTQDDICAALEKPLKKLSKPVPSKATLSKLVDTIQPMSNNPGSRVSDYIYIYKSTRPDTTAMYNTLKDYIAEMCKLGSDCEVRAGAFEKGYSVWCKGNLLTMEGKKSIKDFIETNYKRKEVGRRVMYIGLTLKQAVSSSEEDDDEMEIEPVATVGSFEKPLVTQCGETKFTEDNNAAIKMVKLNLLTLYSEFQKQDNKVSYNSFLIRFFTE
jgi:hypothetical protein